MFGFLKKDKKIDDVIVEFEKQVIETSNVSKELESLAKASGLTSKSLDFKILSYKTFYKKVNNPQYKELKEIDREKFFHKKNILNPDLEIMQKLKIEVFKKGSSSFPIKMAIGANKSFTKVMAVIKKQENVQYFDGLETEIFAQLDVRKAKQGVLLGYLDDKMRSEIKKLLSTIRVNKAIEEDVKIVICQGYDVQVPSSGEIIYKYKEKDLDESKKVDHSNKDYMHTVASGDVIIVVKPEHEGSVGRDCKGKIIKIKKVELSQKIPQVVVSEDIECNEDDNETTYIARKSGFINEVKPNNFEISDELIVNEVSFKTTGSIEAGGENDIKINIESKDAMSDAIGAGVHIETSEVKAEGNVGNGAVVKASIISIGGQTHQSASLYGGEVSINLHKGYAEGELVEVEILEGGKIVADVVRIKKASGGTIEAKEVYIETLLSNVQVSASHHIELEKVEGTGNKLIIDAKAQRGFAQKVEEIEDANKSIKISIETNTKKLKQIKAKIMSEQETTVKIMSRIKELKAAGVKPPSSLVSKMIENQNRIKEHNLLIKELKDATMQSKTLSEDLINLQSSVFDATVVNKSTWREFNEVIFQVISPPVVASHLLKDGEIAHEITLKEAKEGEFILNRKG